MNTTKKTLLSVLVAVLAVSVGANVYAQTVMDKIMSGEPVGKYLSAVSTDVALVVRYVGGAAGGGEIAVAAGGDITLTVNTAADTTTECPIAGAYGGVIDVSDASCDTLGEVCDAINFGGNWRCAIVNGLRSDSSDNTLATLVAATADSMDGRPLLWDTAVALHMTEAIIPSESITAFVNTGSTSAPLLANPFRDSRGVLHYFSGTVTTSGAATISIYSVRVNQVPSTINAAGTGFDGSSETVTTLLSVPGGATTVEKSLDFRHWPGMQSKKGEKLVVRESATTDLTVPLISSWGTYYNY
jgi:hypothetical protein